MGKIKNFFLIAGASFILLILFVFMRLPLNETNEKAVNRRLDLTSIQWSKDDIFLLNGPWEMYFGFLYYPMDLNTIKSETRAIPSRWTKYGSPIVNCATYRLLVFTGSAGAISLYVPETKYASSIYVNGTLNLNTGVASQKKIEEIIRCSNELLPTFPENGVVEIVVQVSNYHFFAGSIVNGFKLSEAAAVYKSFLRTRGCSVFILGLIFFIAVYHFTQYAFQKKERENLTFSFVCLFSCLRLLFETNGLNYYYQFLPFGKSTFKLSIALFLIHTMFLFYYPLYIFKNKFSLKHKRNYWLYALFVMLLYTLSPMNRIFSTVIFNTAYLSLLCCTIYIAARSKRRQINSWINLYLAALIVYLFLGTAGKLYLEKQFYMFPLITNLFMLLSLSLNLSHNYTLAFELVEQNNERLESTVEERTKDLQRANTIMKELIGNISHDLKTPLTILNINLEKLQQDPPAGPLSQQYINIALNKALDLKRLIQNLLEAGRIESGNSLVHLKWVPLDMFLLQVQDKYGDFLESENLNFSIGFGESVDIQIDPQKIWSVFDNIIYNALRYTPKGGDIEINAIRLKDTVEIRISDTGCGVSQEHLPFIFNRFYKANNGNSGESGIGLYIVKSIMNSIGGSVSAQSFAGQGMTIVLCFLAQSEPPA